MSQSFLSCDREQALLMPLSLRGWLAADELAWCVLDVVEEMDLSVFYGVYRADGHGRAAFDPAMMVALSLYGYAVGERSSRGVERRCRVGVAFRVITASQAPITRRSLASGHAMSGHCPGLFAQVLGLCARAGLIALGVVALDGTKLAANASGWLTGPTSRSRLSC
jgi:transposase